jgi:hypothetical protein
MDFLPYYFVMQLGNMKFSPENANSRWKGQIILVVLARHLCDSSIGEITL